MHSDLSNRMAAILVGLHRHIWTSPSVNSQYFGPTLERTAVAAAELECEAEDAEAANSENLADEAPAPPQRFV